VGAARPVGHVRHVGSDAQRIGLDRQALERGVRFRQSHAGAVDDQRSVLRCVDDAAAELGHEPLGARARAVPDGDVGRPGAEQGVDRGARGAAGAEHQRAHPGGIHRQRLEQPGDVGVVGGDPPALEERERVRGADRRGGLRRLVRERERRLLVRDRHVDPAEAGGGQRAHRLSEALGRQRQPQVAPAGQPSRRERGVLHRGRARVRDRPAGDAQVGQHFCGGALPPFFSRAAS
jgi:hypothetical protein